MAVNKNLPQAVIAEYVAGAKDMETRLYIMEKIKDKLEKEKINLMCNIEKEKREAEKKYKAEKFNASTTGIIIGNITWVLTNLLILSFYIGMLIIPAGIVGCILTEGSEMTIVWAALIAIIFGVINFCRDSGPVSRRNKKAERIKMEEKFKEAECNLKAVRYQNELKMNAVSILNAKIIEISKSIKITKESLDTYYRANIIPADYRRGVYMVAIDYVFRNGQANTLKEATLICDHHIRHIDIIEGSNDICNAYHCSANHVKDIEGKLSTIYAEIRKIALCQENPNEEFELTYYAAESTAKSAEYTEWCVRNHI